MIRIAYAKPGIGLGGGNKECCGITGGHFQSAYIKGVLTKIYLFVFYAKW